ncbi:MAG: carboxypeptidase M32 [Treponema sp.]|nr:carboxypeptidase M32 [Treponema sp.]
MEQLRKLDRERIRLSQAAAVLHWDQECYLPPEGVEDRAEQLAVLQGLAHEKLIDPRLGELLDKLDEDVPPAVPPAENEFPARDFLRVLRRDYGRARKLPGDFVRECAKAEGLSQAAWIEARKQKDYAAFAPHLEKMIDLARKKAEYWGWEKTRLYDGLLDFHEPGLGVKELAALFGPLREHLQGFLKKITAQPQPEGAFFHQTYDSSKQDTFCREVLAGLGFNARRGRLDLSAHPFTTTLGFNDVRITTRYGKNDPLSGLFSVIHEGGHAFYELGMDPSLRSSCLAEGTSMGIHESQSRLWENVIGRSRSFWRPWFPCLKKYFPDQLGGTGFDEFYRAVNTVIPGPIRVEADEVSYSLHIILRFEMEERLFAGSLTVNELPAAWNTAMKDYLGVECADDAEGILQDVHWSMGAFGYFPSYALGNLYALQFWEKLCTDIPGVEEALEKQEYGLIHNWLREKIHRKGRSAEPAVLIKEITERELSLESFLRYIKTKYSELYGL